MSKYSALWEYVSEVRAKLQKIAKDIPTNRFSEASAWFEANTGLSPESRTKIANLLEKWERLEVEMNSSPD